MRPRGLARPTYPHQRTETYLEFANDALLMRQLPRIAKSAAMLQCLYTKLHQRLMRCMTQMWRWQPLCRLGHLSHHDASTRGE